MMSITQLDIPPYVCTPMTQRNVYRACESPYTLESTFNQDNIERLTRWFNANYL